jgi:hypothetical protein
MFRKIRTARCASRVDGDGLFNRVRWRFGARSGGEMQTFFACSNPACDERWETLKDEFGTACQQCAWCRSTRDDRRESAEDNNACL